MFPNELVVTVLNEQFTRLFIVIVSIIGNVSKILHKSNKLEKLDYKRDRLLSINIVHNGIDFQ